MENRPFNQIAKSYDTKQRKELAKVIVRAIQNELKERRVNTLLDYGCGTGLVGLELSPLVDKLFMVDSAEPMIEIVKEKIFRANIKNAEVIHSDFAKVPAPVFADVIVVSLVLLHIREVRKMLTYFYSALNENGKLVIVDFDKNEKVNHPEVHNGFDPADLKFLLHEVGFKKVEIKTIYHGKNIFMNQDASLFPSSSRK